jgi:hypothetical protein
MVTDIVTEMEYLRAREQRLRDTNESTNERVKWFAFGTMGMLVGLGAWQVVYLRAYFRYVGIELAFGLELELGADFCDCVVDPSTLSRFLLLGFGPVPDLAVWNGCIMDGLVLLFFLVTKRLHCNPFLLVSTGILF